MVNERQNWNCVIDTYWIFENICQDKNGFTLWKKVVAGMSAGGKLKLAENVLLKRKREKLMLTFIWSPVCLTKMKFLGSYQTANLGNVLLKQFLMYIY